MSANHVAELGLPWCPVPFPHPTPTGQQPRPPLPSGSSALSASPAAPNPTGPNAGKLAPATKQSLGETLVLYLADTLHPRVTALLVLLRALPRRTGVPAGSTALAVPAACLAAIPPARTVHGPVRLPLCPVALAAVAGARAAAAVQEQPPGTPCSAALPQDFHPRAA